MAKSTERVRQILSWYGSDNPGTLSNLARLLNHGTLAGTGKLVFQERAESGRYYASPIAANGHVYFTSLNDGTVTVMRVDSEKAEVVELKQVVDKRFGLENIIGSSACMEEVFDVIRQVAPSRATVLTSGAHGARTSRPATIRPGAGPAACRAAAGAARRDGRRRRSRPSAPSSSSCRRTSRRSRTPPLAPGERGHTDPDLHAVAGVSDRVALGSREAVGFREVGVYERHARLDGEWRDCVIVERLIGEGASTIGK